ncbi:hypothetical protein LNV08_15580 [Paucibacter sp. TC2R-5]|uniref:hypothetical protein n=1 Tax=Paucibacter sp. TC2R-5 TaxID=2893555 RepID=UPI0021E4B135|nr:hypothetical protein [Paucibacter sp. TC2R-5]MCV2360397.1 hypothetical protein [Paucibacter sp. TC2R-5]
MRPLAAIVIATLFTAYSAGIAAQVSSLPKPDLNASRQCSAEDSRSAASISGVSEALVACFIVERYVFQGSALAVKVDSRRFADFRQLRREVFRDQSTRLRTERDMAQAMPGEPPAHGTIPSSLFVLKRTPIGVFTDEAAYIGFADLVPWSTSSDKYPLLIMETYVSHGNDILRLVVTSLVSGPETIARGYALAEDWSKAVSAYAK